MASGISIMQVQQKRDKVIIEHLSKVAPGTDLRYGIDQIIKAKTGALIVVGDSKKVVNIAEGGFFINCEFTPFRLYELAKMDGAIILNSDITRIIKANTQLIPDPSFSTNETGTRHRTAERMARQTGALVISISQKRDVVSLYFNGMKYVLDDINVVLERANQALRTLEKYKIRLNEVYLNLTMLEIKNLVTLFDVASVIQRVQMLITVSMEVDRYIYELGIEGRLIEMQKNELMADVVFNCVDLIKDYLDSSKDVELRDIKDKILLQKSERIATLEQIVALLGYSKYKAPEDRVLTPKGYRILSKALKLPQSMYEILISRFDDLQGILKAKKEDLSSIDGLDIKKAVSLIESLNTLKESITSEGVRTT